MSIQYPAPGFELATFWLRVSSLNQTRAPPLHLLYKVRLVIINHFFYLLLPGRLSDSVEERCLCPRSRVRGLARLKLCQVRGHEDSFVRPPTLLVQLAHLFPLYSDDLRRPHAERQVVQNVLRLFWRSEHLRFGFCSVQHLLMLLMLYDRFWHFWTWGRCSVWSSWKNYKWVTSRRYIETSGNVTFIGPNWERFR